MVGGVSSTADDKSNGNLFVSASLIIGCGVLEGQNDYIVLNSFELRSAMRSFFANAIKMSQLEAVWFMPLPYTELAVAVEAG